MGPRARQDLRSLSLIMAPGVEFESSRHREIFEISSHAVNKTVESHLNELTVERL